MPTSLYMPSVVVEIAFNAGYTTPAASRTWTDVTDYVELSEGIDITYGRQDERSTADANQCSLTLDNSDGRFTAERAASPYYPNVKVGRPIRVKATPVGGSEQVRFTGFVDEWPVVWDGTDAYASTRITAASRLARLGLNTALRSVIEEEILQDAPVAYYTLGEPEGSTSASDSSGNGALPLETAGSGAAVVFGQATGPGTDGLTAATFAGGQRLRAKVHAVPNTDMTLEFFILRNGAPSSDEYVAAFDELAIKITTAGTLVVELEGGGTLTSGSMTDGQTHLVSYRSGIAGSRRLYLDGIMHSTVGTLPTPATLRTLSVGGTSGRTGLSGVMAHVAIFTPMVAASAHWTAGSTGFAGETAAVRLQRYLDWSGVPATSYFITTDAATPVAHVDTTGMQVTDLLQRIEAAEGGVIFDSRADVLTFRSRNFRYTASSSFTLSMAAQDVGADFLPRLDRSALLNDVLVTSVSGVTARAVNTGSRDEYGVVAESVETMAQPVTIPQDLANWRVGTYAEPRIRVPTLSVDILALAASGSSPTPATILAADVGTLFAVTGQPGQAPATSSTYFVEGYTETIGGLSYAMTFNVSPSYPHANVLILDDATRGRLDQGNLIAF